MLLSYSIIPVTIAVVVSISLIYAYIKPFAEHDLPDPWIRTFYNRYHELSGDHNPRTLNGND